MPKAANTTPEKLWKLFHEKAAAAEKAADDNWEESDGFDRYVWLGIDKIEADIKATVDVDFENCYWSHTDEYHHWEGMLGYRQTICRSEGALAIPEAYGNTLSYIGVIAGGDWEYPVYFIIYLDSDGETLRAYVPKNGNVFNHDTKSAFGNDDQADTQFLKKWVKENAERLSDKSINHFENASEESPIEIEDTEIMFNKSAIRRELMHEFTV